jgi:hypothetical protein
MLGTHESLEMLGRICGKRHAKNHDFPRQQKELNVFHDCFFIIYLCMDTIDLS